MTEYVQIITPLESFLQDVTPKPSKMSMSNLKNIETSLHEIFPEQQCIDKDISEVKKILGENSKELSDLELPSIVAEVQYLTSTWLDEFEKELFNGLTLNELLHEKGDGL